MMGELAILAEALRYPAPGRIEILQSSLMGMSPGAVKTAFAGFVVRVQALSLNEWEELCTRTLDLKPAVAPYVGFQIWGESYQRGAFMAGLRPALEQAQVELDGELPDHLAPVLRLLDQATPPSGELLEILPNAVQKMANVLRKAEADNPYLFLFMAIETAICHLEVDRKEKI